MLGMYSMPVYADQLFADLVVTNANVITVDKEKSQAEAFAVRDGKFVSVGTNGDVRLLIGKNTTVIEAEGKTITPGFIDAHLHPKPIFSWTHRLGSVDLSPAGVKTMEELIAALKPKRK